MNQYTIAHQSVAGLEWTAHFDQPSDDMAIGYIQRAAKHDPLLKRSNMGKSHLWRHEDGEPSKLVATFQISETTNVEIERP